MIIGTKTVEMKIEKAFGKGEVSIQPISDILNRLKLDPNVASPRIDAYVVSMMDFKTAGNKQDFRDAAASKHPGNRIILVARGKCDIPEGNGIDKVLINGTPQMISAVVAGFAQETMATQSVPETSPSIPEFVLDEGSVKEETPEPVVEVEQFSTSEPIQELHVESIEQPAQEEEKDEPQQSEFVSRIKECQRVVDVEALSRELKAADIVKDIIKDNKQYLAVEERLKVLQEKINSIFLDNSISSIEEKMEKIDAVLIDKDYYRSQNNTILEKRIEEIITTLVDKVKDCIYTRLNELDVAIQNTQRTAQVDYPRLGAVVDERANVLLEISKLNEQLESIYVASDSFAREVAANMSADSANPTGNPLVDAHLRLRGSSLISEKAFDSIREIIETADRTSEEYKQAQRDLHAVYQRMMRIIELDNEALAAFRDIIALRKAVKLEDTITANTPLKQNMRIFIGDEGSGRSIIPYIVSKRKSRESANVLLVDLTGTDKYSDYGVGGISLESFYEDIPNKDLLVVKGNPADSIDEAGKLLATLTRAADYYRVINVVLKPELRLFYNILGVEAGVVNYIVTPARQHIVKYKNMISDTYIENTAQRVILNKCDIGIEPVLQQLGVIDNPRVHFVRVGNSNAIVECGLNGLDPTLVKSVLELTREVCASC